MTEAPPSLRALLLVLLVGELFFLLLKGDLALGAIHNALNIASVTPNDQKREENGAQGDHARRRHSCENDLEIRQKVLKN